MTMDLTMDRAWFEGRISRNRLLAERTKNASIRTLHMDYVRMYEALLACQVETDEQAFA